MQFLATIALLVVTATASPLNPIFNLQVSQSSRFNGKYIGSEHTAESGPLNSLVVFYDLQDAGNFTLVNGTVNYQAPNQSPKPAPWKLALSFDNSKSGSLSLLFSGVHIFVDPVSLISFAARSEAASSLDIGVNLVTGSEGFSVSSDGKLQSSDKTWNGWLGKL